MYFAKTIMHELIHAYFYYRTDDAFGNPTKTQKLEKELGFLKPFNPNVPLTPGDKSQHEQMANSYIEKFVKGLSSTF